MKNPVSKSWAVTLVAFIMAVAAPIMDGPLADYGIDITEKDLEHFLYLMLGVGATGVAAGGTKKVMEIKKEDKKQMHVLENIETLVKREIENKKTGATDPGQQPKKPKENGMQDHGWYKTNLGYKEHTGAVLEKSNPFLMIKVPDSTVISGTIKKDDNIIQVAQGTDSLNFKLMRKDNAGGIQPLTGEMEFNFKAFIDDRWNGASGRFTVL